MTPAVVAAVVALEVVAHVHMSLFWKKVCKVPNFRQRGGVQNPGADVDNSHFN